MRQLTPIICFLFFSQSAIAQCSAACLNTFMAALDNNCEYTANTTDLLEQLCPGGIYVVEVFDENGILIPGSPTVDGSYLGDNLSYTITETNSGNSCFGNIILEDETPPNTVCLANFSLQLDASGNALLDPSMLDGGTVDNCSSQFTYIASQTSFDCSNLGSNFVNLIVMDESGNSATCFSSVDILDNNAVCPPPALFVTGPLGANENYCAGETIDSDAQTLQGITINFNAAESILLLAGFEVITGSEFSAIIGPCID